MKNISQMVETVIVDINETDKLNVVNNIYEALFKNLKGVWYTGTDDKMFNSREYNILDCYCSRNKVKRFLPETIEYKYYGLDPVSHYTGDDGNRCVPEIISDINQIPVKDDTFDTIFMYGNRFGFGSYHKSLFEIERIIKKEGKLICSLSKYVFQKGINQMLLVYRNWHYDKNVEVRYTLIDKDEPRPIQTSVFFTIYSYKG